MSSSSAHLPVAEQAPEEMLAAGEADVYLCGPPPMVDAVRHYLDSNNLRPASFHYEKFTPNAPLKATA